MFIQMDVGGVVEPKPVPPARYDLVITSAEFRPPKTPDKGPMIQVNIGIEGHETAPNVTHWLSLPKPDDDAEKQFFKKLMMKRFLTQFHVPYNEGEGFNVEDFSGCRANVELGLSSPDDSKDGKTVYNRLVLDKLPTEE